MDNEQVAAVAGFPAGLTSAFEFYYSAARLLKNPTDVGYGKSIKGMKALPWLRHFRIRSAAEFGTSCRQPRAWDPRDHILLKFLGAHPRIGFPRRGSGILLTDSLERPGSRAHHYEYRRTVGRVLNLNMPAREEMQRLPKPGGEVVVVHTGAGQPVKVWPLERYRNLVARLRGEHYTVCVLCDTEQQSWWLAAGEKEVTVPGSVEELSAALNQAGALIGNDSGPGPPGGPQRRSHLHIVQFEAAGMVRSAPAGGRMDD